MNMFILMLGSTIIQPLAAGDLGRVWNTAPSELREVDHAFLSRTGQGCEMYFLGPWEGLGPKPEGIILNVCLMVL